MAENTEERAEKVAPLDHSEEEESNNEPLGTGRFEDEWERMKGVIFQQSRIINDLYAEVRQLRQDPPSKKPPVIIKPRDVPILSLQKLEGLESAGTLNIFFDLIEQCSPDDEERVRIAKSKMEPELTVTLMNKQAQGQCNTWAELKLFFRTEFAADMNFDRAWQEIESFQYDWASSPQAFTNKLNCRYAILESRFPTEKFPDKHKTIKRKLWRGFPSDIRKKMVAFLDEDYPLQKFLDRVEHERQFLVAHHTSTVNSIPGKVEQPTPPANPGTSIPKQENSELKAQLEALNLKVERLTRNQSKFCPYCRTRSHNLRDCNKHPPLGVCFDCARPNCRRGRPGCPGRSETS